MAAPHRSDELWARLARVPRGVAIVVALVVVLAGLFIPGPVGGVLLLVVGALLALLMRRTWPVTPTAMRTMRLLVLAALIVVGLAKIFGAA